MKNSNKNSNKKSNKQIKMITPMTIEQQFRDFWKKKAAHKCEITTNWVYGLSLRLGVEETCGDKGAIRQFVDEAIQEWKNNYEHFSQLIMATNWMAWFCYESERYEGYTDFFSDLYYELLVITEKSFTEEERVNLFILLD